jgi:hypothetical protein
VLSCQNPPRLQELCDSLASGLEPKFCNELEKAYC